MFNVFKNEDLTFKYPDNWKLLDDDIENCLAILDSGSGFSRIMVIKYPEEGLSLKYLKSAIEDIPRADSLKIDKSDYTLIGDKETHELISYDNTHNPPLKTHSLATISGRDAFIFNFFTFGKDNLQDCEDFFNIYESLSFF